MTEDIFQAANRIRQKEVNIFLQSISNISIGQRIRALKKYLDVLHRGYVKNHESPCLDNSCIECCYAVPIIRSRSEFTYLKKALNLNYHALSIGSTIPSLFTEWTSFCKSAGINPHYPFVHQEAMAEWIGYRIPCPLYSTRHGVCLIEDTRPIDCRFGRDNRCPKYSLSRPEELNLWEIVEIRLDLRITLSAIHSNPRNHIDLRDPGISRTWVDEISGLMAKVDSRMFPDKPPFRPQPIHVLFERR